MDDEEDEDDEDLLEPGEEEHAKGDDDGDVPMEGTETTGDRCDSDGGWVGGGDFRWEWEWTEWTIL